MNYFTQHVRALSIFGAIVCAAGFVSAGNPAIPNPGGFPSNNTPFPITVGTYDQIKGAGAPPASGGGLAVEAFSAWKNASFDKEVGVQGILTGKPVSAGNSNSNLSFGTTGNTVTVGTTGWTYTQNGGLYTGIQKAPTGKLMPLCAKTTGEIIICPGATPINP